MNTPAKLSICVSISFTCVTSQLRWAPRRSCRKLSTSSMSSSAPSSSASRKARAMFFSASPTYIDSRSDARRTSSGMSSCSASQRPKAVLPVPGGPYRHRRALRVAAMPCASAARSASACRKAGSYTSGRRLASWRGSGRWPWACSVWLTRCSKALALAARPTSASMAWATVLARATTAGARCSASATRARRGASSRSPQCACTMRARWLRGGTGSSNTMSKRRMKAASIPATVLDSHSVGTGLSSSMRLSQALCDWAVPRSSGLSWNTSSTSSNSSSALRCARKLCAARKARRRLTGLIGSPSSSSLATSNRSQPRSCARARASSVLPVPGAPCTYRLTPRRCVHCAWRSQGCTMSSVGFMWP